MGPLTMGSFGENLTTDGLLEGDIHLGDELEIGTSRFVVTQPRLPCYKLQVRFMRPEMTKLFYQSRRFGFYLKVLREGKILAGQLIEIVKRDENAVTVADLIALYTGDAHGRDVLERVLRVRALPPGWREDLRATACASRYCIRLSFRYTVACSAVATRMASYTPCHAERGRGRDEDACSAEISSPRAPSLRSLADYLRSG